MKHLIRNIAILAALLFGITVFLIPYPHITAPEQAFVEPIDSAPEETPRVVSYTIPVRIIIDAIGVNAMVDSVGISGRAMAVPTSSTEVGWYAYGVRPGQVGSAVLAGHVNWYGGKDAVFTNLHTLEQGDIISVIDADGTEIQFQVRESRRYQLNDDTSEIFLSDDGKSHLNLITCDGVWSSIMGTHDSRLVVFADKIDLVEAQESIEDVNDEGTENSEQ